MTDCGTSCAFNGRFDPMISIRHNPSDRVNDLMMILHKSRMYETRPVVDKINYSLKTGLNAIDNLKMWRMTL
jgi:hypothetical protein